MPRKVLVVRMLIAAVAIAVVGAIAIYTAMRPKLSHTLQDVTIARTASDQWRQTQSTLQMPVNVYAAAWYQALGTRIATDVGVAAMADGDSPDAFCVPNVMFDLNGTRLVYCKAKHAGPDPLPQAGFILLPYAPYKAVLPDVSTEDGQIVATQGTALLLARGYAWHLLVQLIDRKLISSGDAEQLYRHLDCLAGLSLRAYVPALDKKRWPQILGFANHFTVQLRQNPTDPVQTGYESGHLSSCIG